MLRHATLLLLLLTSPALAQELPPPRDLDPLVRELTTALNEADAASIHALSAPILQEHLPLPALEQLCASLRGAIGSITGFEQLQGARYLLHGERGEVELRFSLDAGGKLNMLSLKPPEAPPPPVAQNETPLRLPFAGDWTVVWGGADENDNKHVRHRNQRRAVDLVITDAEGQTHTGDGQRNEDYYAYGQDVLAAGDGEVVFAIDGVPDCVPGVLNAYSAVGNAVMVRHADETYAVYAHLIPGSLEVAAGDAVTAGQRLGRCGNSGNSSEPHLHFHLQDGPRLEDAWGVEAVFGGVAVTRGGQATQPERYTFLRKDVVRPADEGR